MSHGGMQIEDFIIEENLSTFSTFLSSGQSRFQN